MLHHFKEPPLIKEYGLAIPPGSEAYISTRTLKMHNLGEPFLVSPFSPQGSVLSLLSHVSEPF